MAKDDAAGSTQRAPDAVGLRDPEKLIGRTLGGKYRVLDVLARGGMGRIYRAEQLPLGRAVALKVLHSELAETGDDPGFQKRFLLEAASCAQLRHPNIVVVYDYGRLEDTEREAYFMAMELLEGRTLHQLLREEGALAPARALRIAREVARALREAHRKDMVHRDLKPSNVMLVSTAEGEQVKVLDFGLVKVVRDDSEELTQEGHFMGSPKYMAPEQIRRGPIDARADLYALGVMLYQMLAGRLPFEGEQPVQTLMAHLNDPVPPLPPELGLPPSLPMLVLRCLEKDPDARIASADALVRAIDEVAPLVPGWTPPSAATGPSAVDDAPTITSPSSSFSGSWAEAASAASGARPIAGAEPSPARRSAPIALIAVAAIAAAVAAVMASRPADDAEPVADIGAPAPAAPASAPPPPPSAPARFTLFVASQPSGATLYRGEERIGATPTYVVLERDELEAAPATFRLELEGHGPYLWAQGPSSDDVRVDAILAPLPAAPAPAPATAPATAERRRRERPAAPSEPQPPPAPEDFAIKTRR